MLIQRATAFARKEGGLVSRKSRPARLKDQREYQGEQRRKRRPGRDDFARYWFWKCIFEAGRRLDGKSMNKLELALLDGMEGQGFDRAEADDALGELIDKYVEGRWDFRVKRHLEPNRPPFPGTE